MNDEWWTINDEGCFIFDPASRVSSERSGSDIDLFMDQGIIIVNRSLSSRRRRAARDDSVFCCWGVEVLSCWGEVPARRFVNHRSGKRSEGWNPPTGGEGGLSCWGDAPALCNVLHSGELPFGQGIRLRPENSVLRPDKLPCPYTIIIFAAVFGRIAIRPFIFRILLILVRISIPLFYSTPSGLVVGWSLLFTVIQPLRGCLSRLASFYCYSTPSGLLMWCGRFYCYSTPSGFLGSRVRANCSFPPTVYCLPSTVLLFPFIFYLLFCLPFIFLLLSFIFYLFFLPLQNF